MAFTFTALCAMPAWLTISSAKGIQDYDCHLADYTRNGKERPGRKISRDVLTLALCDFIIEAKRAAAITVIYDYSDSSSIGLRCLASRRSETSVRSAGAPAILSPSTRN